jgi:hypothetical protein
VRVTRNRDDVGGDAHGSTMPRIRWNANAFHSFSWGRGAEAPHGGQTGTEERGPKPPTGTSSTR